MIQILKNETELIIRCLILLGHIMKGINFYDKVFSNNSSRFFIQKYRLKTEFIVDKGIKFLLKKLKNLIIA